MVRRCRALVFLVVATMVSVGAIAIPAGHAAEVTTTTLVAAGSGSVSSACALLTPAELQSVLRGTVGAFEPFSVQGLKAALDSIRDPLSRGK